MVLSVFFIWMKVQLFEGCLLALIVSLILLFSHASVLLPFLESFFTRGMCFLSASSMFPKSLQAICKDLTPLANPYRVFFQQVFSFLWSFPFWSWADIYLAFTVPSRMFQGSPSRLLIEKRSLTAVCWTRSCVLLKSKSRSCFSSGGLRGCLPHAGYTCKSTCHHVASTEGRRVKISFTSTCAALVLVLPRLFCWIHSNRSVTLIGGEWRKKRRQLLFRKIWKMYLSWVSVMG